MLTLVCATRVLVKEHHAGKLAYHVVLGVYRRIWHGRGGCL
jgi:hypothetical protein